MKAHIERIIQAMLWADARVIGGLSDCSAQAESLPLLAHVLAAEHVWLARLERRAAQVPVWPALSLADCESLAAENTDGYQAYLERICEAGLTDVIEYRNQKGQEYATSVVDILTHVVIHGAYHRGQIAKIIGRSGVSPPDTDYIAYVRASDDS